MLFKLSLRNARRQTRDYLVYFITMIMAAALIFAFNGLVDSREIRYVSEMMTGMPLVIALASLVIVMIMGWLVHYTMRFMLIKRSHEFGTYMLMGLEDKQVIRLYFMENAVIGGGALLTGELLGNVIYQGLRAIILHMFDQPFYINFRFSPVPVVLTLVYFILIFAFAMWRSRRFIRKVNIHGLLYLEKQNETEAVKKKRQREIGFTLSVVLLVLGTGMLMLRQAVITVAGALVIIVALYGFFINFSSGVPAFFKKHPLIKYKGTNLLVFRSLASKLTTMGITMATIAVLFTATLAAEGCGLLFANMGQRRIELTTKFDFYVGSSDINSDLADYQRCLQENEGIRDAHIYYVYLNETDNVMEFIKEKTPKNLFNYEKDTLLKMSDYKSLRKMLGYPEVETRPGEYIIHCLDHLADVAEMYEEAVQVGEHSLTKGGIYSENLNQYLWDGNGSGFILVVPDEVIGEQQKAVKSGAFMTKEPLSAETVNKMNQLRDEREAGGSYYESLYSVKDIRDENSSTMAVIVFPLFYLALVLTMAAATILTIQLLSESNRYREQFELLHKLGMDQKDMQSSLRRQFILFYTMPTVPPLLINVTLMISLGSAFDAGIIKSGFHLFSLIAVTLLLFTVIYGIYIFISYSSLKKNVFPKELPL